MFNEDLENLKKRVEKLERDKAIGVWYDPCKETRILSKAHASDAG